MEALIEYLPEIILYLAVGFAFLKTYHFVALRQNVNSPEHIVVGSLVVGFIYCNIAELIPFSISYYVDIIGLIATAVILGYLCGRFVVSVTGSKILDKIGICDTGNVYLWDDLMDKDWPMKVVIKFQDRSYEGMLNNFESYSNAPHMSIASYIIKDQSGNIIENHSNDQGAIIVLPTENAISVKVEYAEKSRMREDIISLCDTNEKYFNSH